MTSPRVIFQQLLNSGIGSDDSRAIDRSLRRRIRMANGFTLSVVATALCAFALTRSPELRFFCALSWIFNGLLWMSLRCGVSLGLVAHLQILLGITLACMTIAGAGGSRSVIIACLEFFPSYAGRILGLKSAFLYAAVVAAITGGFFAIDSSAIKLVSFVAPQSEGLLAFSVLISLTVAVLGETAATLHANRQDEEQLLAANRDMEKARNIAEAATRAKSDFLANMSYEIRTPMNGVSA